MDDDRHAGSLGDVIDEAHGRGRRAAEPQPVVRRHQEDRVGARLAGGDRMVDRLVAALRRHAGDRLHGAAGGGIGLADGTGHDPHHLRPLLGPQRHDLAGVAVADHSLDACHRGHAQDVVMQALLVDRLVVEKRAERRRKDTAPRAGPPRRGEGTVWRGRGRGHAESSGGERGVMNGLRRCGPDGVAPATPRARAWG